jgi:hypothetical protein
MDGAHNNRHYEAGDTVKLEIVLHHRANLREVRVIFEHTHDKSVAPLIARGPVPDLRERQMARSGAAWTPKLRCLGQSLPVSTNSLASAMRRQGDS